MLVANTRNTPYLPRQRIAAPAVRVRRERLLEMPGQVFAQTGQSVRPNDVIARSAGEPTLRVVDVAEALDLKPSAARDAVQVDIGTTVTTDTVLAQTRKLLRRNVLRAPVDGQVVHVDGRGTILIQTQGEEEILRAGLRGQVVDVMARFGAVIEATGALVQGVWGNGQQKLGVIRMLTATPDMSLSSELFDAGLRGAIVVAGKTVDVDVFDAAAEAHIQGLVVGSLHPDLLAIARRQRSYAVVVTDGVNRESMAQPIFDILQENEGREATIDARRRTERKRQVAEIFVARSLQEAADVREDSPLQEGDVVRAVAPPYLGRTGTVTTVDAGRQTLESGLELPGCTVTFLGGDTQFVPYANLERLTGCTLE